MTDRKTYDGMTPYGILREGGTEHHGPFFCCLFPKCGFGYVPDESEFGYRVDFLNAEKITVMPEGGIESLDAAITEYCASFRTRSHRSVRLLLRSGRQESGTGAA